MHYILVQISDQANGKRLIHFFYHARNAHGNAQRYACSSCGGNKVASAKIISVGSILNFQVNDLSIL